MVRVYSNDEPIQVELSRFKRSGVFKLPEDRSTDLYFFIVNQYNVETIVSLEYASRIQEKLLEYTDKGTLWIYERTPFFTVCGPLIALDFGEDLIAIVQYKQGCIIPKNPKPIKADELPKTLNGKSSCMCVHGLAKAQIALSIIFDNADIVYVKSDNESVLEAISAKRYFNS